MSKQRHLLFMLVAALLGVVVPLNAAFAQRPQNAPKDVAKNAAVVTSMSGPRTIKLRIPEGNCALDRTHRADSRFVTTAERLLQNINVLHLTTVSCKTLKDWRAGRVAALLEYTQVQSQIVPDNVDLKGKERNTIRAACEGMRQFGDSIASGAAGEIERRLTAGREKVKIAGNAFLGVLAEDRNGCYLGLLLRIVPPGSKQVVERLAVYAHVILAGRTTFLYRFSSDVSPASLSSLIEDRKAAAADHVTLNGGYGTEL